MNYLNFKSLLLKYFRLYLLILIVINPHFILANNNEFDDIISNGKILFKSHCSVCHDINKNLIGPKLKNIDNKYSKEWLIKWIYDSSSMIQNGDEDAIKIYKEYKESVMPSFTYLSNNEITNILSYIKYESEYNNNNIINNTDINNKNIINNNILIILFLLIIILFIIYILLNKVVNVLIKILKYKKEISYIDCIFKYFIKKIGIFFKKKIFIVFTCILLFIIFIVIGLNTIWNIGIDQYYQPEQPIKFSHKIHSGINKIDCRYCHNEAWKGKYANIPSLNICMNCHSVIDGEKSNSQFMKTEIEKLYKILDFDPITQTYGNNTTSIEWIKIHNLPDFAYFNHSQHVNLGSEAIKKLYGLKSDEAVCYACHGKIDSMNEVYQAEKLTMGWCIECHKKAKIDNIQEKKYYESLLDIHQNITNIDNITVATIGGLECSSCHY